MALNNPYVKYKQQSVNTATPEELTLMLYDGCIKFINIAKIAIEGKDYQTAHKNIIKAEDIITEFIVTLNMEYEVSKNLKELYVFYYNLLVEANLKKDISILEDVKTFVVEMRNTWKEAMILSRKGK